MFADVIKYSLEIFDLNSLYSANIFRTAEYGKYRKSLLFR